MIVEIKYKWQTLNIKVKFGGQPLSSVHSQWLWFVGIVEVPQNVSGILVSAH